MLSDKPHRTMEAIGEVVKARKEAPIIGSIDSSAGARKP